jgi:peptide/nickel transport system permease protein
VSAAEVDSAATRPRGFGAPLWLVTLRRALDLGRTRLGLVLTVIVIAVAVVGPHVAPHAPAEFVGPPFANASGSALLGTDNLGRDVLSRTLWGGGSILWMSLAATVLGMSLGMLVGLAAGSARRSIDAVLMSLMDVMLAFPQIVLVLLFIAFLGARIWLIVLLVALSHVPRVARLTRSVTLQTLHREFVLAAEALAVPRRWILLREVLPNLSTPLLVEAGVRLTWSITLIASVSFLGFGIQPPNADWGLMINENRNGLVLAPWAVIAPVLCIACFAIGANLLAEGLSRSLARISSERPEP